MKHECYSAVELPGAVRQPWRVKQPGKPRGSVERHDVRSEIQGLQRSIATYTPPGYRREGPPNNLLFLFDGPAFLSSENAMPTTMDNLIGDGKIPPTVAVFVATAAIGG